MASDSLTAFLHPERGDHVISLYRDGKGAYISIDYIYPYRLFELDRDEDEDNIGPKVIVEWSK